MWIAVGWGLEVSLSTGHWGNIPVPHHVSPSTQSKPCATCTALGLCQDLLLDCHPRLTVQLACPPAPPCTLLAERRQQGGAVGTGCHRASEVPIDLLTPELPSATCSNQRRARVAPAASSTIFFHGQPGCPHPNEESPPHAHPPELGGPFRSEGSPASTRLACATGARPKSAKRRSQVLVSLIDSGLRGFIHHIHRRTSPSTTRSRRSESASSRELIYRGGGGKSRSHGTPRRQIRFEGRCLQCLDGR